VAASAMICSGRNVLALGAPPDAKNYFG
jgi:hypothetical protein